jgi:hypothetical protein
MYRFLISGSRTAANGSMGRQAVNHGGTSVTSTIHTRKIHTRLYNSPTHPPASHINHHSGGQRAPGPKVSTSDGRVNLGHRLPREHTVVDSRDAGAPTAVPSHGSPSMINSTSSVVPPSPEADDGHNVELDHEECIDDITVGKRGSLPLFNCASYNARSMHAHTPHSKNNHFHTHIKNIKALLDTHDIVHILETKFSGKEQFILNDSFPNHNVYYNNLNRRTAGTATLVKAALAKDFMVTFQVLDPGYTAYVNLQPLPHSPYTASARYFSIYLFTGHNATNTQRQRKRKRDTSTFTHTHDSDDADNDTHAYNQDDTDGDHDTDTDDNKAEAGTGRHHAQAHGSTKPYDHWTTRTRQIKTLARLDRQDFEFYSGDWNFVHSQEDTPHTKMTSHYRIPPHFQKVWDKFIVKHKLAEAHQPYHTRYQFSRDKGALITSSRLDRHYTNVSEALLELYTMKAQIPRIPVGMIDSLKAFNYLVKNKTIRPTKPQSLPTDHTPISLTFHKINPAHRGYRCPEWTLNHSSFPAEVAHRYVQDPDPYLNLISLNKAIVAASRAIAKRYRSNFTHGYEILTYATKLLRVVTTTDAGDSAASDFLAKHPQLNRFQTPGGGVDRVALETEIDKLLEDQRTGDDTTPNMGARNAHAYKNFIATASASLPFTKARFTSLRPTPHQASTDDPRRMAKIATRFWKKNLAH